MSTTTIAPAATKQATFVADKGGPVEVAEVRNARDAKFVQAGGGFIFDSVAEAQDALAQLFLDGKETHPSRTLKVTGRPVIVAGAAPVRGRKPADKAAKATVKVTVEVPSDKGGEAATEGPGITEPMPEAVAQAEETAKERRNRKARERRAAKKARA